MLKTIILSVIVLYTGKYITTGTCNAFIKHGGYLKLNYPTKNVQDDAITIDIKSDDLEIEIIIESVPSKKNPDVSEADEGNRFFSLCNSKYPYRNIDGSCNNVQNRFLGTPKTPYARFMNNSYSDGVHAFARSKSNEPLTNPREISLKVFPDEDKVDPVWTLLTMSWGQSIAHDLTLANVITSVVCCDKGHYTLHQKFDPRCAAIPIPKDDPYNGPEGNECYNFYRTQTTIFTKPSEQISDVTHFMDLSIVYGSSDKDARDLRSFKGGRLLSVVRDGQEWLPQNRAAQAVCFNVSSPDEPCYRAGDERVNQNTPLTVLHIMLMREHNRIADALCGNNSCPKWDDEKCYQEARRILIAMNQWINYYEFLPIMIGRDHMVKNNLIFPDAKGYVNDYDRKVNPPVLNEFATAAWRNYHSSIPGYLRLLDDKNQGMVGTLRLSDHMNKPSIIERGNNSRSLSRCLYTQHQQLVDRFYDKEITNYLFKNDQKLGQDLRSTDILRGRDHGLATYVTALRTCNIINATSFEDLIKIIPSSSVKLLQEVYEDVEDVDLVVGAGLETLMPNALTGPTFQCIMTEQFLRTRRGDRFFFENGPYTGSFTREQLQSIREGTSMASIICNNSDGMDKIQKNAFLAVSASNPLVSCGDLPQVNLTLFLDKKC